MRASKQAVAQGEGNELPPLANDRAQEHLDKYRDAMKEAHGENIPWVKVPLDPQVMYKCTGRKPHGKFAIADGAIDSSQVQFSTNVRPSPSHSSSSQRERELEQEVRDLKRSFCNAFAKFNEDLTQFMRQGCPDAPPPQIDLALLFQNPVPPTSKPHTRPGCENASVPQINLASFPPSSVPARPPSDIMDNNSVNATMRHISGTPSRHVGQQPPPNIYRQQGGTDINSVNVAPRQMNENSYEHLTGQAFQMPYQQVTMCYCYVFTTLHYWSTYILVRNCTNAFFLVKDGTRNNSGSVDLQRMDGSTFRYLARQNTFQPESMQPSIRDQGTPTTNYHSSHMRDKDTTDNGGNVFF
ncbi:hypothetical protein C2845_PM07G26920 [Panicum miliaceum]|uniref:Uncharacterized protein n=1 Tax=Panicum miliaceum TaxID=4540 RepID=A0A3L6SQE3_PANMI|nr:hypothetical protein C2845_PM07G26920 [Panicum miliaceum]